MRQSIRDQEASEEGEEGEEASRASNLHIGRAFHERKPATKSRGNTQRWDRSA